MGKYTCPECVTDGGYHYDDPDNPQRCPNYLSTVQHEEALQLTKVQNEAAFKAAKQIVRDFADTLDEFSSNDTWDAMQQAQIPSGTVGRAFTACEADGDIENTERRVKHRDESVRHKVYVWRSLRRPSAAHPFNGVAKSSAVAAGVTQTERAS